MSDLIQLNTNKNYNHKPQKTTSLTKFKQLIYQEINKISIACSSQQYQSTTIFYFYTLLDPVRFYLAQLFWTIKVENRKILISVAYSTFRTLGFQTFFKDERTKIQINFALRLINLNIPCYLTFLLDQKGQINIFYEKQLQDLFSIKQLFLQVKTIIHQIRIISFQNFSFILPHLSFNVQSIIKNINASQPLKQKERQQPIDNEYLLKLKNSFDRYRKNKDKATIIMLQERDYKKIKDKIQCAINFLHHQLTIFNQAKYKLSEYRPQKILKTFKLNENLQAYFPLRKQKIAYQFEILEVEQLQKKLDINANSNISVGKYHFRIFKTIVQKESKNLKNNDKNDKQYDSTSDQTQFSKPKSQINANQNKQSIIEQRFSYLVKKRPNNQLSEKALKNQLNFLKFVRNQVCKYISSYYLSFETNCKQIFLDYYDQTLQQLIDQNQSNSKILSFTSVIQLLIKIALGIKFLNQLHICHRDIKPSNIMINKQIDPKIIDFGSIISIYNKKSILVYTERLCGTKKYYFAYQDCPQHIRLMFLKSQYEAHALFDVYSYGVIAQKMMKNLLNQQQCPLQIDILKYLILRCQQINPDNRLCFDEILCILYAVVTKRQARFQ